jgi:ATP-dependent DNA helicase RecG
LKKELSLFTFKDLLDFYPYRHIDKTEVLNIGDVTPQNDYVQVLGQLNSFEVIGEGRAKRLVAFINDGTGEMELVWFQGISWIQKMLVIGKPYLVFGKTSYFANQLQITHPEIEVFTPENAAGKAFLEPVYPSTEKLKSNGLSGRQIGKLTQHLFSLISEKDLPENLPGYLIKELKFLPRFKSLQQIHFPSDQRMYNAAVRRLKFEELFFAQLRLGLVRVKRHRFSKGLVFETVGSLFNQFYNNFLPFELTGAQKRVLKEIRKDTGSGKQMNRLLQGDVGSGKTMVALLSMLIAADNSYQSCLMAPTEILARQHFSGIEALLKDMPICVKILTGSSTAKQRKEALAMAEDGSLNILIGTHAVIEDKVQFKNLGLAVIDEQHRFGVEQRARLWRKNETNPHILVMTATPIPRTLALTAYGDLDYSIMDELPPGRIPITTVHRYENARPQVMDFIKDEIKKGRQAYIIYPLIEESSKVDYENLLKGYEEVKAFFPEPQYYISMVHGRQKPAQKDLNMQRFVKGDTQIMVSTTVIEVGVNVPNATVMVIESAEKFGLPQLHQLRGRVGRGAEKSYCILLTGSKISKESRERLKIMVETNDGFKIAEKDLALRGPGDIEGTRQSGELNFKLANIISDRDILEHARKVSDKILQEDVELEKPEHLPLRNYLGTMKGKTAWSKIS